MTPDVLRHRKEGVDFSLLPEFFQKPFLFLQSLDKGAWSGIFFIFYFSIYVYANQAGYFRKTENLIGEHRPTNLGNPPGQSSLSRYLAWSSSSVFVSDSGLCISTKTGTSWGTPVRDPGMSQALEHVAGKRKGMDWGLVGSMEM